MLLTKYLLLKIFFSKIVTIHNVFKMFLPSAYKARYLSIVTFK